MVALCTLVAALAVTASNTDLAAAEAAFDGGDYEAVLPSVQKALSQNLSVEERTRAWEITALTHAAFDRAAEAVQAFRHLAFVDPSWAPKDHASPKVRGYFEKARSLGALPDPNAPALASNAKPASSAGSSEPWAPSASAASGSDPGVEASAPLYSRWWFWAGVSAVAVGAAGVTYAATRPQLPAGSLGTGALRR